MRRFLPILLLLSACGDTSTPAAAPPPPPASTPPAATAPASPPATPAPVSFAPGCQTAIRTCMQQRNTPPPTVIDPARTYTATVHTSRGDFGIALDAKAAPVTVNNFVYLSQNHFYDGLTFHRVEPGFVVQGGDPQGTGTGGTGYNLPNETNPAPWVKGSVGMASASGAKVTNGAQFFVLLGDALSLANSGVYNHFATVTAGSDVLNAIQVGDRITSISITAR